MYTIFDATRSDIRNQRNQEFERLSAEKEFCEEKYVKNLCNPEDRVPLLIE